MAGCVGQAACGGQDTMSAHLVNPFRYTANATMILPDALACGMQSIAGRRAAAQP